MPIRILDFVDGFESASAPTSVSFPASSVTNTPSGNLAATTAQAALNELQGDIDTLNNKIGASSGIASLDSGGKVPAAQIPLVALVDVSVVADIAARDALTVQEGDVAVVTNAGSGVSKTYIYNGSSWTELVTDGSLYSHLTDAADAHAASAITNTPSGNLAATTVQAALNELQTDIDTRATSTDLTNHVNDAGDAHDASAISNSPSGNLAATDVQGALDELQTSIDAITGASDQSYELTNLGLAASVGSNAITFALKIKDGSTDPSGGSPVKIGFRSATLTSGLYVQRSVTAALSFVLSSGSTGGHASGVAGYHYIYAIDNAGTVELGRCGIMLDEGVLQTSTAEGGAGAADSLHVLYSTTARTDKAVRLIGRVRATQATAGTHATAPSEVTVVPFITDEKPFLAVHGVAPSVTANIAIKLPTVDTDTHGCYDTSTGLYTTKRLGWYRVTYSIANPQAVGNIVYASVNGSTYGVFSGTGLGWHAVTGQPSGGTGLVKITTVGWTISIRPTANQSGGGNTQDTMTIEWVREI